MNQSAQLFELDNVRRFKGFWAKCSPEEQIEIFNIVKIEMGEEVIESLSKKQLDAQAEEIINFLNAKTGKGFRLVETHKKTIRARLRSGITVQELKAIIAMKTREWMGTDAEDKLRPATLFAEKLCENYLGNLN